MDNTNNAPNNPAETWDLVQGVIIKQMFDAFNPGTTSMCSYRQNFINQNSGLNQAGIIEIFSRHNVNCQ